MTQAMIPNGHPLPFPVQDDSSVVPVLPESAPFTPEQRAYLNGFFAGLFSRAPAAASSSAPAMSSDKPLKPLTILFGSQTGTTESLAKKVAAEGGKRGFVPNVVEMAQYPMENFTGEGRLLILTSTYGDGEPPDNARGLWEFLGGERAPRLEKIEFSVLGLGDSNYPKFCQCAKDFDTRLESLGARRIHPRVDCDVDYEEPFHLWLNGVLSALEGMSQEPSALRKTDAAAKMEAAAENAYSRKNPFPARLVVNRTLTGNGSGKETRHFEISLEGSGLAYEAGDALGVVPSNCPVLVEEILGALRGTGDEPVVVGKTACTLHEALLRHVEIQRIPKDLVSLLAAKSGNPALYDLADGAHQAQWEEFTLGRGVIDLLLQCLGAKLEANDFLKCLRPLQPRLYSIASSPKANPHSVHLTVGIVRYVTHGRERKGVCSTFLADRVKDAPLPVFVHTNPHFRPPRDGSRPVIMIGPGTGIAPFRGFLQERKASGASGKNWLFFGDQHESTDFLYREEWNLFQKEGVLTRLDAAFSRDQAEKIYVQHRMLEHASELFAWLEEGAHFYVCGDAKRMAKDVDTALHELIRKASGRTTEQAAEYVQTLKNDKRYQRDVY